MRSYTLSARLFLVSVWLAGLIALLVTFVSAPVKGDNLDIPGICLAVILAIVAGGRKVQVLRSSRWSEAVNISLGFLVTFVAMLTFGLRAGVLVGAVSGLSATLFPRRQPLHQMLFNVGAIATTAWISGGVYLLINGRMGGDPNLRLFAALMAAAGTYFACNSCLVAVIFALCSGKSALAVWRDNFLWTAPSYLAGASCAALGQLLLHGQDSTLLLALPILAFTFQAYKLYAQKAEQKELYIQELQAGRQALADLYLSTIKSLASAIAAKDQYTHTHIQRVQNYATAVAEEMGVKGVELEAIRTGALLHDIGKLGVPDYVLLKPGPLSTDEFEKMKRHPVIGAAILEPVDFPWPVADVVRHHHERWDGTGYPDRLAGEQIPLGARIMAVADVYDALTSERPYRPAWSQERTLDFLQAEAGVQFDPKVVAAFLKVAASTQSIQTEAEPAAAAISQAHGHVTGQIHRTASELWVLYEIGQTLNQSIPLPDRLELLGRKLTSAMPGTTCAFMLYDPLPGLCSSDAESGENSKMSGIGYRVSDHSQRELETSESGSAAARRLHVVAAAGARADALKQHDTIDPESPSAQVARSRMAYRGPYISDGLNGMAICPVETPARSALIVPLLNVGETLGTISFFHPEADAFSTDDESLLRMIAEQVQIEIDREMTHDRMRSEALTDALTGLYNLRYLKETFLTYYGTEQGRVSTDCAVLYLDLDNFKQINDSYGHQRGNSVLNALAQLLPLGLRPDDVVVRLHGDEFLVVLMQAGEAEAKEVAARIRTAVQGYRIELPGGIFTRQPTLDISIGIACCPRDARDMDELISIADTRMFAEKAIHKKHPLTPIPDEVPLDMRDLSSLVIIPGHRAAS